jgi:hypothetical protein
MAKEGNEVRNLGIFEVYIEFRNTKATKLSSRKIMRSGEWSKYLQKIWCCSLAKSAYKVFRRLPCQGVGESNPCFSIE